MAGSMVQGDWVEREQSNGEMSLYSENGASL